MASEELERLGERVQQVRDAGMLPITDAHREAFAVALVLQGYGLSRAYRMAMEDIADNDGVLQMLARQCAITPRNTPKADWCSTCGKSVAEILCPICTKWWADNPPSAEPKAPSEREAVGLAGELAAIAPHLPEHGFDTFVLVPEGLRDRILSALQREAVDPVKYAAWLTGERHRAAALQREAPAELKEVEGRFWLSLRDPGCVPDRKGPWPLSQTTKVLREVIAARPTAYIDYITLDCEGEPLIQHGPEVLQIADGRSMSTGRNHNKRVRSAAALIEQQAAELALLKQQIGESGRG